MKKILAVLFVCFIFTSFFLIANAFAGEKEIVWRFQSTWPKTDATWEGIEYWKKEIEDKTNGRLILKIHQIGEFYGAKDIFDAVSHGGIDAALTYTAYYSGITQLGVLAAGWPGSYKDFIEYFNIIYGHGLLDVLREERDFFDIPKQYGLQILAMFLIFASAEGSRLFRITKFFQCPPHRLCEILKLHYTNFLCYLKLHKMAGLVF